MGGTHNYLIIAVVAVLLAARVGFGLIRSRRQRAVGATEHGAEPGAEPAAGHRAEPAAAPVAGGLGGPSPPELAGGPGASAAILVEDLSKRYGALTAIDAMSFTVAAGQTVALLGPNGAGKTTTVEILEGFLPRSGGRVRVLGQDPRHADRAWRARVGVVTQSTALDAQLTVAEALTVFGRLYPRPRPVPELLELAGLQDEAGTRIGALSGGQRRRVDVALGIIGRPELVFLDEPTTGFDPAARRQAWAGIENLSAAGTTVVLTTHYLDEADQLANRVIVLAEGRIVADATPGELRARAGGAMLRYRLPTAICAQSLPAGLTRYLSPGHRTIVARSAEVPVALESLLSWARTGHRDLAGLEIGPPSLEDAYLDLTAGPRPPGRPEASQ